MSENGVVFFLNNFTDFNYVSRLVWYASSKGQKVSLVWYDTDLKRPSKTLFSQRRSEFLKLDFISEQNNVFLERKRDLRMYMRKGGDVLVSTTPSLYQLLQKSFLRSKHWQSVIGLDYLGEFTREVVSDIDAVCVSSPLFSPELP